jgi:aspartate kinase
MHNKKIVSKFGGTSMGSVEAMKRSAQISKDHNSFIIAVSATSGTTDKLIELAKAAEHGNWDTCEKVLFHLQEKHFNFLNALNNPEEMKAHMDDLFLELETLSRGIFLLRECSLKAMDKILSFGERISSLIFTQITQQVWPEKKIEFIDIRKVLKTDSNFGKATPNIQATEVLAKSTFKDNGNNVYVTQGFIGSDENNMTTTLGRGGSDYSAALIAEAIDADLLEIWTDVAGIATTDPRICSDAQMIHEISYEEASEMAQYGAKVLHPTTMAPAVRKNIPVFVGSSFDPHQPGTWIKHEVENLPIVRAITKRQRQSLLTITTPKMLNAYGFMAKIFEVFSRNHISIDCVTTSEISVAITVDQTTLDNKAMIQDLKNLGDVEIENGYSLISLIGNNMLEKSGIAKSIFNSIDQTNIRMMSFGASAHNFNFLVREDESNNVIQKLHATFVGTLA